MLMLAKYPRLRRLIASGLLVQFGSQLVLPTVSYALTSGPTAPEATSFEPVDTTDMVNLNSGDFTYNIPLLDVPGPEGGYPLALSYHAGIQPNEEASWVGLGWSLNPGAISRSVNGFADDHNGAAQTTHDYWQGGGTSTYSVGVTVGTYGTGGNVSMGLAFSQDTYRGFNVDMSGGASVGVGIPNTPFRVGAQIQTNAFGGTTLGINAGATLGKASGQGLALTGSVGLYTNFESISATANVGVSADNHNLMGASINSSGGSPSFHVGNGSISIQNEKAGTIQTESNGFSVSIPVSGYLFLDLGYNYVRYWSDETLTATTNGALYYPTTYNNSSYYDNQAYDTYRLPDPFTENSLDNPDPNYIQGGTFPDYDNYYVTAQGLSGSMRPYAYQHALVSQTRKASNQVPTIKSESIGFYNHSLGFRFANDFSNRYLQTPSANWYNNNGQVAYPFDQNPVWGDNDLLYGYSTSNHLVGSKHIEWFTNDDISNGTAAAKGFIDTSSPGFTRQTGTVMGPQIGGFMITNESGVTYHYALPAYSFYEEVYTEAVNHSNGLSFNHVTKPSKYAYTWFLTAMTGPDYVDRGTAGVDASDWGYWVSFTYGKWSDGYTWRNPSEGFHRDLDGKFQTFSTGKKEIYYLNSIATRTHTALFEKAFRMDGKGATDQIGTADRQHNDNTETTYIPKGESLSNNGQSFINSYYPGLQMRLNRVLLFANQDLSATQAQLNTASTVYNLVDENSQPYPDNFYNSFGYTHHGENVLDVEDVKSLGTNFTSKALRIITLQHDYSLTPGVTNSYGTEADPYDGATGVHRGKLTLNALSFGGVGGANLLPATRFFYDAPPTAGEQLTVNTVAGGLIAANNVGEVQLAAASNFVAGDILKLKSGTLETYATLLEQLPAQANSTRYPIRYLTSPFPSAGACQATATKNPPYLKDAYDNWGMFKSDYDEDLSGVAQTSISRRATKLSNSNVDVWSLRRILSPLGATIKVQYAGDTYGPPVISQTKVLCRSNGYTYNQNEASQKIGHISLGYFSYQQALHLFAPNQVIHVAGLMGPTLAQPVCPDQATSMCNYHALRYEDDVALKVLSVDNANGSGMLKVQVLNSMDDVFYYVGTNYPNSCRNNDLAMGYFGYIKSLEEGSRLVSYGGGIRVASVSVLDGALTHTTNYDYATLGTTSYEPVQDYSPSPVVYKTYRDMWSKCGDAQTAADSFRDNLLNRLPLLLALSRELVPPGVMYERVQITESVTNGADAFTNLGTVAYQFEVFNRSMLGIVGAPFQNDTPGSNVEFRTRQMAIKDMTSRLGNLKRVTHYDAQGKVLAETVNHYASDDIVPTGAANFDSPAPTGTLAQTANAYETKLAAYHAQGIIKESYGDYRSVLRGDGRYDTKGVISQRETYPNVKTGATIVDHRFGITTKTETLGFDFYSGIPTSVATTDGYGNRWLTQTLPAYRKYPAMGPVASPAANGSVSNRNMLSQTAATTTYKVDAANNAMSVRSATAQTWSDAHAVLGADPDPTKPFATATQPGIWRPAAMYTWLPTSSTADGLTPLSGFTDFPFTSTSAAPWQKTNEITRYNVFSNTLEVKDINGQYVATKMGFQHSKVLISGGPARYSELAYTGAEEELTNGFFGEDLYASWDTGGADLYTGQPGSANVHTGTHSVRVHSQHDGPAYYPARAKLNTSTGYRASVWASSPDVGLYYCVDGNTSQAVTVMGQASQQANGWYLITLNIPPLTTMQTNLRVGIWNGTAHDVYVDDFRFQPVNAAATAYVYDAHTGQVTDILDNTNLATHYQYDAVGRLTQVRRESFNTPSGVVNQANAQYTYHYARQPLPLDAPDLQIVATPSATNTYQVQFTVQATGLTSADYSIAYKSGVGTSGGTAQNTATFSYTYPGSGTYWATVRLTDKLTPSHVREFAVKVVL